MIAITTVVRLGLARVPATERICPCENTTEIMVNHGLPDTMNEAVPGKPIDWGAHQVLALHNFAVDAELALRGSA